MPWGCRSGSVASTVTEWEVAVLEAGRRSEAEAAPL